MLSSALLLRLVKKKQLSCVGPKSLGEGTCVSGAAATEPDGAGRGRATRSGRAVGAEPSPRPAPSHKAKGQARCEARLAVKKREAS